MLTVEVFAKDGGSGSGGSAGKVYDTQFKVDDTQFWFWRFCGELGVG